MHLPDLRGYELESQIYSAPSRLVVIWFSKIDRDAARWRQVQVTLVGAKLSVANLEIVHGFRPLKSCAISKNLTAVTGGIRFDLTFEHGSMSFECEDLTYSEYSRQIRMISGA